MTSKEFIVDSQAEVGAFLQHLNVAYKCSEKPTRRANEFYYDTFDWRLFNKDLLLKRIGKYFYLISASGDVLLKEPGLADKHFFFSDVPESPLQKKIESVAGIRALSEILFLRKKSTQFNVLNKDRKTVIHLFHEQGQIGDNAEDKNISPLLRIVQVRGYEKPYARAIQIARKTGLQERVDGQSFFEEALTVIGRKPGDYTSGFDVSLDQNSTIEKAFNHICLPLVETMEQNYQGLLRDVDSEFLHDFRVAIRRTRSFISQFKKSFQGTEMAFFQDEFKWLGVLTGPVRDLDVYLLMKEQYASMLPVELHNGLEQFFVDLKKTRLRKFEEMQNSLRSERYLRLIAEWKSFLDQNGQVNKEPGRGTQLCRPLALKKIRKCLKKILKKGGKLDQKSSDEDLHRLRIQGKKLRYLIEFFRSFFDAEEIEYFRKQLKKLQDMLGDFNDISVQLEMLSYVQQKLTGRNKRSVAIAAAIGGLITCLNAEHETLRNKFTTVFADFGSTKNIERFYRVLV